MKTALAAVAAAVLAVAGMAAVASTPPSLPQFTDIAAQAGIAFHHINGASPERHLAETMGSGGLFFDYDGDGFDDVFLVDGGSIVDAALDHRAQPRLYHNRGNGTFEDVTSRSGIRHQGYGMGACSGDYDGDGRPDLFITSYGPDTLYRNRGDGTFEDVTAVAHIGASPWSASCAFADLDHDGDLDLWVVNYVDADRHHSPYCGDAKRGMRFYCHPLEYEPLPSTVYRNDGNGVFTDVTKASGVGAFSGNGLGIVVTDYDDDGLPDVFVANDSMPNFLFHNTGGFHFAENGLAAGVAVGADGHARAGMGIDAGDYDGDGRVDLVITNLDFEMHTLSRGLGHGLFSYVTTESGIGFPTLPFVGFGVTFFDFDNDGQLDIAMANGHILDNAPLFRPGSTYAQRPLLFRNASSRFIEVGRLAGPAFAAQRVGRGLAAGDFDNDGDLDLLITNNGQDAELLRNDGGNRGHALLIRLRGSGRNTEAIGARVLVTAGGRTQLRDIKAGSSYLSQNDLRAHVGLGTATRADRIVVKWPSGRTETLSSVAADQILTIEEGKGIVARQPFAR